MFTCADIAYMQKIAVGPEAADVIDIDLSPTENLGRISRALKKRVEDLVVVILDRPRHTELIAEVRAAGSRIKLITDGDVAGAIMTAIPGTGVDVLMGIGGVPEAVVAAAALTCVGGAIQGRLWLRNDEERAIVERDKIDVTRKFATRDLVSGHNIFFSATGITDGELLRGVHLTSHGATTQTLVMRSASGTVRRIDAEHRHEKLEQLRNLRNLSPRAHNGS
jgi:fructose-1,6-bisphosphatase II